MGPSQKIRALVVDDHPLMVAGIVREINAQADMQVLYFGKDVLMSFDEPILSVEWICFLSIVR